MCVVKESHGSESLLADFQTHCPIFPAPWSPPSLHSLAELVQGALSVNRRPEETDSTTPCGCVCRQSVARGSDDASYTTDAAALRADVDECFRFVTGGEAAGLRPSTPPHETEVAVAVRLGEMMGWDKDDGEEAWEKSDDSSDDGHAGSVEGDEDRARGDAAADMMHHLDGGADAAKHTQRAIRHQEAEHAALQAQLKVLQAAQSHRLVAMGRIVSTSSSTPVSVAGADSPVRTIPRLNANVPSHPHSLAGSIVPFIFKIFEWRAWTQRRAL